MKLTVGITELTPGWITVLQQIGVLFKEIKSIENYNLQDFVVIIVSSSSLSKKEKKILYDFVENGGAVLTEAKCAEAVFNINIRNSYIKFLYSKSDTLFNNYLISDLFGWYKIAKDSNHLENQKKRNVVLTSLIGKGDIIVFPEGFVSSLNDNRTIRKNFYSEYSKIYSSERVSKISKGKIRIHIQKSLEYLFHKKNLPFVHLWFFPANAKNIFSFRVDTDFGTMNEINSLNNLLQDHNIPSTWFVETKSSKNWIRSFSEIENIEIAYHCYRHKTFLSYKKNEEDMKFGLKILNNAGFKPKGYAAPFGKWNKTIANIIDNFNFLYSSEFDFAYDTLPYYPYFNFSFSKALQIPIHPVSVGRLHWGGHSEENMVKYYLNIIEQKLLLNDPIILYTHPFENRLKVFGKVFEKISELNIPTLKFCEYAKWWKKRLNLTWDVEIKDGNMFVSAIGSDESIRCRVVAPSGEKFFLSFNSNQKEKITNNNFYYATNLDPNDLRKMTIKMIKYDILGFLRKLKL